MKMALNAKNKLSFVNGSFSKPTSSTAEIQLSWIYHGLRTATNFALTSPSICCNFFLFPAAALTNHIW
jgi:hypothetical protein